MVEGTKVREEGAGEGAPDARVRIPLDPYGRPWWRRYFPATCGENHSGADIYNAACGKDHASAIGYAAKELSKIPPRSSLSLKGCSP